MATEVQNQEANVDAIKQEPQTPSKGENGEAFRGRGRGRGGFRGRGGPMLSTNQGGRGMMPSEMNNSDMNDHNFRGRGRGRGRGSGRGSRGGGLSSGPPDRIIEKLKQIAGPQVDLPPRDDSTKKFSNHCRLWIGNLPLDITEDDVTEMFKPFGEFDEDYKSNAEKAKQELHMKDYRGRQLKIRFSSPGTTLKVRNLSHQVSNELLERAFGVFGELEKSTVITDERGRSTGEGILEFCKKPNAMIGLKRCQEGCFFITSSPRPVIVEQMPTVDDNEGMCEVNINKRNPEYMKERQTGPRFASPGSFEFEYGLKWKQLYELFDKKKEMLEKELADEKQKLEEQIEYAKYQHETELLREQLRQREESNAMQQQEYEQRQRDWEDRRRQEEDRQRRIEDDLALKFRQQEEELRRRQEENRQFMQERASDLMKVNSVQDSYSGGYQEGGSWRSNIDGYSGSRGGGTAGGGSAGGTGNWRGSGSGAGSETWTRGGVGGRGTGQSWDSWENRQDPWQADERGYQRGATDGEVPPPDPHSFLDNFNRGRTFEESSTELMRGREVRSHWGRSDREDYGPSKRARY